MSQPRYWKLAVAVFVITAVAGAPLTVGVASADTDLSISTEVTVPDVPLIDTESEMTTRLFVNGTQVNTNTVTVSDGETTQISFNHSFAETGPREVHINASVSFDGTSYAADSPSATIDINPEPIQQLSLSATVPNQTTVGEPTTVTTTVGLPDSAGINATGEVELSISAENETKASQTINLSDGQERTVNLTGQFNQTGEVEVTIAANGTIANVSRSVSVTRSVFVNGTLINQTQATGVAFTVPPSLKDEVAAYRQNSTVGDELAAFVLANEDELYIVFTDQQPVTGTVEVAGATLEENITYRNLTFGVIGATTASFNQTGNATTVSSVQNNTEQYQRELVRINATHRRVSTLSDPDKGGNITLATTVGVLVENASTPEELFTNTGERATNFLLNSTRENTSNASVEVDKLLGNADQSHLATVSFETKFWADANASVDGVVLTPGSAAREFVATVDQANVTGSEGSEPVLYVVDERLETNEQANVSEIKTNAETLDGEVVEVETRVYQNRISVQETLEAVAPCQGDLVQIPTPSGPICLPVTQDVLLHAGVGWNTVPTSQEEVLLVVGASSTHQDTQSTIQTGRYRVVGEIVHTSRIDGSLPNGSVLIIYELTKLGPINMTETGDEAEQIIRNQTEVPGDSFRSQINRTRSETIPPLGQFRDPPTNPDGDAIYEDVNGDGEFNIVDVQALYVVRENSAVQEHRSSFDVNGDGQVNIVDVQALYAELRTG